jgi:lipoyl(octanoyl) transferase
MNLDLNVRDLGIIGYQEALDLQTSLQGQRQADAVPDTLLLLEHKSVYTLGRSGSENNILAGRDKLAAMGVQVVRTSRGGDVTYHGPGQLVGYPIINIKARGLGVVDYVHALEEVLIAVLGEYKISAGRDNKHRGVWIGRDKVAAIGVKVSRNVTMHGFALNVAMDLKYFENIVPCGIQGRGVTSLDKLLPGISMSDVKARVASQFRRVFGCEEGS